MLEMAGYPNPNLVANGTHINQLAVVTFDFAGI